MNATVYEVLLGTGFGLAAAVVAALATVGLLVWLAGCQLPMPRPAGARHRSGRKSG